jgi:hypothetical protein
MKSRCLQFARAFMVTATVCLAMAETALAHPGHGVLVQDGDSATHYVLEPSHGAAAFVVAMVGLVAVVLIRQHRVAGRAGD